MPFTRRKVKSSVRYVVGKPKIFGKMCFFHEAVNALQGLCRPSTVNPVMKLAINSSRPSHRCSRTGLSIALA